MHFIALLIGTVALSALAPRVADRLAALITYGFILPFFVFGGGAFVWAALELFSASHVPYTACCLFGGLPLGIFVTRAVMS